MFGKYLLVEHVEIFKIQLQQVINVVKNSTLLHPESLSQLNVDDDVNPLTKLSDSTLPLVHTLQSTTNTSHIGGAVVGAESAGVTPVLQRASSVNWKRLYSAVMKREMERGERKEAEGAMEVSSDAEYFTPMTSPDDSRRSSVISITAVNVR